MTTFIAKTAFQPLDNGLARREGTMSDGLAAVEVRFDAGAFGQLQKRDCALQTRVLSGEFEFTVGGDQHLLTAGESIEIAARVASGCFCLAAGSLLEIIRPR
ncbi:cupin domain-containing protein [Serratia sp. 1D1416]|uniref:cupin domain-containing protein n=1 Tax=Serratia sp. 1D1416 TaxID=2447890 RepID=UPI001013C66B|nr:cupin domain-containing protein [Serratia sp. 1D1416]